MSLQRWQRDSLFRNNDMPSLLEHVLHLGAGGSYEEFL